MVLIFIITPCDMQEAKSHACEFIFENDIINPR